MTAARPYAEIAVTTNFSFLRGASHPRELVLAAALLLIAAGLLLERAGVDPNSVRRREE